MMRKSEIDFHSDGYRAGRPAVNVKVYRSLDSVALPLELGSSYPTGHPELIEHHTSDVRFDRGWMEENVSDDTWSDLFDMACEDGWEQLQEVATDILGTGVKVWSEGRQGGWAVVRGLPDFESWDAIDVSRWGRFAKYARMIADDVPRVMVDSAYVNLFLPWADAQVRDYDHVR